MFRLLRGAIVGSGGSDGGVLELDRRTGYLLTWHVSPTRVPPPDLRPRVGLDRAFASVTQALFAQTDLRANGRILALPQDDPSLYRPKVCLPTKQGTPLAERYEALKNQGQNVLVWHLHVYEVTPGGERLFSNHWVGMVDAITGEVISVGRVGSSGGPGGPALPRLDLRRLETGTIEVGDRRAKTPEFGLAVTNEPGKEVEGRPFPVRGCQGLLHRDLGRRRGRDDRREPLPTLEALPDRPPDPSIVSSIRRRSWRSRGHETAPSGFEGCRPPSGTIRPGLGASFEGVTHRHGRPFRHHAQQDA